MAGLEWNPWKAGAVAAAVIVTTAIITRLVVGNWTRQEASKPAAATPAAPKVVHQAANSRP